MRWGARKLSVRQLGVWLVRLFKSPGVDQANPGPGEQRSGVACVVTMGRNREADAEPGPDRSPRL